MCEVCSKHLSYTSSSKSILEAVHEVGCCSILFRDFATVEKDFAINSSFRFSSGSANSIYFLSRLTANGGRFHHFACWGKHPTAFYRNPSSSFCPQSWKSIERLPLAFCSFKTENQHARSLEGFELAITLRKIRKRMTNSETKFSLGIAPNLNKFARYIEMRIARSSNNGSCQTAETSRPVWLELNTTT